MNGQARGATSEILTVDASGRPVPLVEILMTSEDERVDADPGYGIGTDERGRLLRRDLPAVAYRIQGFTGGGGDDNVLAAEGRVIVPPDGRTTIRLIIK